MRKKQPDGDNGQFLRAMFNDLNDLSEETDEEVTEELTEMGIQVEESHKKFLKMIGTLKEEKEHG